MIFVSIVWNYFEKTPFDICHYVNGLSSIEDVTLLHLGHHFSDFVNDIYICHDITREWIPLKIAAMEKTSNRNVLIITHHILDPQIRYDPIQDRNISESAKKLKENVRNKFNPIYESTSKAPIIHTTDNENESLELLKIVPNYFQFCFYEKIMV